MIQNYPYYGLPNYMNHLNNNSNNFANNSYNANYNNYKNQVNTTNKSFNNYTNFEKKESCSKNFNNKKINGEISHLESTSSTYNPIFNIMGINFYFDDILILCIIFFLYSEHVNDPYLFIILILLLLN